MNSGFHSSATVNSSEAGEQCLFVLAPCSLSGNTGQSEPTLGLASQRQTFKYLHITDSLVSPLFVLQGPLKKDRVSKEETA